MRYDTTLKELFQAPPPRLLQILTHGQIAELLTVEFPSVRMRRTDLVARLTDGRLFHLELQSDAGELLESLSLADNLLAILSRYEDA